MAVYKVPQDVEAEDKFLGPLSFKQFLFFGGAAICAYITFLTITKGVWFLSFVFALPMAGFGFLAFPWSKDQPTEIWLAARIRFMFVKRKRIWDQSGLKELVTITAPKHEVHALTDGLTQDEVRTRFNALASVIDSRGWAVKNLQVADVNRSSDRLVGVDTSTLTNEELIVQQTTDIMDESSNPLAQQFDTMINESKHKHHNDTLKMIEEARQSSSASESPSHDTTLSLPPQTPTSPRQKKVKRDDMWFLNEQQQQTPIDPNLASFKTTEVVKPGERHTPVMGMGVPITGIKEEDEAKLLEAAHRRAQQDAIFKQQSHMKTIQPVAAQAQSDDNATTQTSVSPASSQPVDPAILNLAANDDLNVETLARQAHKDLPPDDEVVITLR